MLQKYYLTRNQATFRELGELRLYLCQWSQMSSYTKFWALSSEIIGFLHGSAKDWVMGEHTSRKNLN
jgi:hypothetical protein